MKVLLASSFYEPYVVGGAERVVVMLSKALVELGHQVAVMTTQPVGPALHTTIGRISVHYIPVRNVYRPLAGGEPGAIRKIMWRALDSYNLLMKPLMRAVIDVEKPDVLNTHNLAGLSVSLWAVAQECRIPIVHTMHDQYLLCHRSTMYRPPRNCIRRCLECRLLTAPRKRQAKRVSTTIGVSEFIVRRHVDNGYFTAPHSRVIYNTALRRAPQPSNRTPGETRAFRFGFLGQIIPSKGVRPLIQAFCSANLSGAELWIGGRRDSPYALSLEAETANDIRFHWLGHVDPDEFFTNIDVLVVPSVWNDTAPLVVLESFGYGVPVLGATRGGIPELVPSNCGWLFDPNDEGSLARALAECSRSTDGLETMRRACIARATKMSEFPWADAYVAAFRAAIEDAKVPSTTSDVS